MHPLSTGALDGLACAADPPRQRACCELFALLTADGTGVMPDFAASLQAPYQEGGDGAEAVPADRPAARDGRYDCQSVCSSVFGTLQAAAVA